MRDEKRDDRDGLSIGYLLRIASSPREVEDTLSRLEREHVDRRPSRITLPPPKVLNDWLWYAAAVAILLLGVIGYLVS